MDAERIAELKDWLRICGLTTQRSILAYIEEIERQNAAMRDYLLTHDHTKHDAAMAAARGA